MVVVILTLSYFLYKEYNKPVKEVKVEIPVKIEVPVPVYVGDTIIEKPIYKVVKRVDSIYLNKYLYLKDSIQKDSLCKSLMVVKEYNEQLDDENITIDVHSNVTGVLNKQNIKYKTKQKTIAVDTTITKEIIVPFKNRFSVGLETGFLEDKITNKFNVGYDMKKWGVSVGIDTEGRKWVGLKYNF